MQGVMLWRRKLCQHGVFQFGDITTSELLKKSLTAYTSGHLK